MTGPAITPNYIYKILPNTSFFQGIPVPVPESFEIKPTEVDVKDGFVHMSTVAQLGGTLNRFFSSKGDSIIQLLKVEYRKLSAAKVVKWEKASDGNSFPHLYGTLVGEYVRDIRLIARGVHGWEHTMSKLSEEGWLEN
jgi:uncharacterized protein (DUF952 family)